MKYISSDLYATEDLFISTDDIRPWIEFLEKTETWEACDGNTVCGKSKEDRVRATDVDKNFVPSLWPLHTTSHGATHVWMDVMHFGRGRFEADAG